MDLKKTNVIPMRTNSVPKPPEKVLLRLSFEGAEPETVEKFFAAAVKKAAPFKAQWSKVIPDDQTLGQLLLAGDVYLCTEGDVLHGVIGVAPRGNKAIFTADILTDPETMAEYANLLVNAILPSVDGLVASVAMPANAVVKDMFFRAGFDEVGKLRRDQLIDGVPQDTLFLEVMNPAVMSAPAVVPQATVAHQVVDEDEKYEEIERAEEMQVTTEPGQAVTAQNMVRPPVWKPQNPPAIGGIREEISMDWSGGQ